MKLFVRALCDRCRTLEPLPSDLINDSSKELFLLTVELSGSSVSSSYSLASDSLLMRLNVDWS